MVAVRNRIVRKEFTTRHGNYSNGVLLFPKSIKLLLLPEFWKVFLRVSGFGFGVAGCGLWVGG